jgi:hypothetical protein
MASRHRHDTKGRTMTTTVSLDYLFECETGGYMADMVVTVRIVPGCAGDYFTPAAPPEIELAEVEAATITTASFSHRFTPADQPAEVALRQIAEAGFLAAYEADEQIRLAIETEAVEAAEEMAKADQEAAAEIFAETCQQAAGRF